MSTFSKNRSLHTKQFSILLELTGILLNPLAGPPGLPGGGEKPTPYVQAGTSPTELQLLYFFIK